MSRLKGSHLSKSHKEAIAKSLVGNKNGIDQKTGKHFNWQRFEIKCGSCGKIVVKKRWQRKYKLHFCNLQCFGKYKATLLGEKNPRYNKQLVHCSTCDKPLGRHPSQVKRSTRYFCNQKCAGQYKAENFTGERVYNWTGGYKRYYGPNWYTQRRRTLERDNYTCQRCGKTKEQLKKNPDIHHLVAFRTFGKESYKEANVLENLITYCATCHSIIEGGKIKADGY